MIVGPLLLAFFQILSQLPLSSGAPYTCSPARRGRTYFDTSDSKAYVCNGTSWAAMEAGTGGGGGGAPTDAKYIVQALHADLSAEQSLGALATGILKSTTTTGVLSIAVAGDFPTLNQDTTGSAATANAGDSATSFFPSGTIETARLGSGTANSTTFLRGDQTWATPAGGGSGAAGQDVLCLPQGHSETTTGQYAGAAGEARAAVYKINAPMLIRSLKVRAGGTGSGTHEWGLFDTSANAAAATKVAGGTGAVTGTGWFAIAATSAPVTVAPGTYILIFRWPSANSASIMYTSLELDIPIAKIQSSYTWDDTPNFTTGWSNDYAIFQMILVGDMDGSGNQW